MKRRKTRRKRRQRPSKHERLGSPGRGRALSAGSGTHGADDARHVGAMKSVAASVDAVMDQVLRRGEERRA